MTFQKGVELIKNSNYTVALTGAGISTEAGIPDFRSPTSGLWNDPAVRASLTSWGFRLFPKKFYQTALTLLPPLLQARPTTTHFLLARLEQVGMLKWVITQNIDGLHQDAGSKNVVELHGTYRRCHCTKCGRSYDLASVLEKVKQGELPPSCNRCNGLLKPDLVLFGDLIPEQSFAQAVREVSRADLLLILGSSLAVYPAAELPRCALASGAKLLIVNLEATDYDRSADFVARSTLGAFSQAVSDGLGLS